jgi:CheY-like chemotaxis protein
MNKKILIFDDDKAILDALESVLDFVDWDLVTYSSGKDAIAVIEREKPDLILMDVMMDGVDGREICQTIKKNPDLMQIPIILISGQQGLEAVSEQDFGPNDFLKYTFSWLLNLLKFRIGQVLFLHNVWAARQKPEVW